MPMVPDGSKLVFASSRDEPNGDIYTLGVGTNSVPGSLARLTNAPTLEGSPAWSPDATKIVFMKFTGTGGNNDLFTVDATPATPLVAAVNITTNPSSDMNPSWGPQPVSRSVVATGRGNAPHVKVFGGAGGALSQQLLPYPANSTGECVLVQVT